VFALALPVLAALLLAYLYATPMPLTDEWLFLRGAMRIKAANLATLNGWETVVGSFVFRIYDHCVAVPFAVYLVVANLANFDSRALVGVTVVCFIVQVWLYRRFLLGSAWWTLPIAMLLFSPSHYAEFLWGFQFTLALSVVLPTCGLIVAGQSLAQPAGPKPWRFFLGLVLISLGAMSAAGGAFGFAACAFLLWLRPIGRRRRVIFTMVLFCAMLVFILGVSPQAPVRLHASCAKLLQALTMLGACIWGSPVGLASFHIDYLSVTGGLILFAGAFALFRAAYLRKMHDITLSFAIAMFGLMTTCATVVEREYVGNWHLQYALPVVGGAYAMSYCVWRGDRSWYGRAPLAVLLVVLALLPVGYVRGFTQFGQGFNANAKQVEDYARRISSEPNLRKPFPPTGGWDFDSEMAAFLIARGHPSISNPGSPSKNPFPPAEPPR
jgi:hypothetical protein